MSKKENELTIDLIKKTCKQFDLSTIIKLDLSNKGLVSIGGLEGCVSLKELILSHNKIQRVEGFHVFTELVSLDLSYNKIQTIETIERIQTLEILQLEGNNIKSIALDQFNEKFPSLRQLYLQNLKEVKGNPITLDPHYIDNFRQNLPQLKILDGKTLAFSKFHEYKQPSNDHQEGDSINLSLHAIEWDYHWEEVSNSHISKSIQLKVSQVKVFKEQIHQCEVELDQSL